MPENFWDNLMETDEHAADYMNSYGEGPGYITRHTVGSFINDGESVLDVGCGPGWNFDHFREYGPRVNYRGIDYSERFVRVARERFLDKYRSSMRDRISVRYNRTPFKKGDTRALTEKNKSWDVVLLQDVLEHTNGYERPVTEALRVARKRVIVSFWHLDDNEGTEHINEDGDDGWGAWYDKNKWEAYLDSLPYPWLTHDIEPEGKTHKWYFYVIDLEGR